MKSKEEILEMFCFEPTYKELKLRTNLRTNLAATGFEPTYKELKLLSIPCIRYHILRFEPTYKELKQTLIKAF